MGLIDIIIKTGKSPLRLTAMLVVPIVITFAGLIILLGFLGENAFDVQFKNQLRDTAKAYTEQILLTRFWNAQHGGVYVKVSEQVQPNPYLQDPEREIMTDKGVQYTKINPAYMTRQISEIADKRGVYKFRITSLDPINPGNSADPWETLALERFESGMDEWSETVDYKGSRYYRYMTPLRVEKPCMKCHARQGYNIGDIRGGLSVSLPASLHEELYRSVRLQSRFGFITISIFSVLIIIFVIWVFMSELSRRLRDELESDRLKTAVKLAGAAAHEMRQPMTVISGLSEMLLMKVRDNEDVAEEADVIVRECERLNDIINRMMHVTAFKTKVYNENTEIFDFDIEDAEAKDDPGSKED